MYKVTIAQNDRYMDESTHVPAGEYSTHEEATSQCKRIVEKSLRSLYTLGMTADKLYQSYMTYGEEPFIVSAESASTPFSAWEYAKEFAKTLSLSSPTATSPTSEPTT